MKGQRSPVLFRWFISYLTILLLPLVFSGAVYFFSLNIINKGSQEIYESSLEQFRIEVDNFFYSSFQTLKQLALNPDIQVLTLVVNELQPRDQWTLIQARNGIRNIQIVFPSFDDIFIVLNPLTSVMTVSAYYPLDLFYQIYFDDETLDIDEFSAMFRNPRVTVHAVWQK